MWQIFQRRALPSSPRSASPTSGSPIVSSPHLRAVPSDSSIASHGGGWVQAAVPPASYAHRILLLAVAGAHVFLTSGVVFGWASLAEALAAEGILCDDDECSGRDAAFAIIFTLGTIGNYTSNLPFGLVLDRYGPNVCCMCGAAAQIVGTLLMLAQPLVGSWVLFPGYFFLGFGGPGVQIATFHLANLFPPVSGSLIAAATALFDAGTAVFFFFSLATRAHGGPLSLASCWLAYLAACLLVLVSGALLWPHAPFEAARDIDDDADDDDVPASAAALLTDEPPPNFGEQLRSRSFAYLVCFASVHILRLNFVVGTFQAQVAALGFDADGVANYTTFFASALPFGFIGMPLIGFALDHRPLTEVFLLVNTSGLACLVLLMVPHSPAALAAGIGLVAVGRQFVYSTFFARLQRTAGPHYGKLAGAANLCVAATGALQPVLLDLAPDTSADGLRFAKANALLLLLVLALFTQPLRCWEDGPLAARSVPLAAAPTASPLAAGGPLATLRVALLPAGSKAAPA